MLFLVGAEQVGALLPATGYAVATMARLRSIRHVPDGCCFRSGSLPSGYASRVAHALIALRPLRVTHVMKIGSAVGTSERATTPLLVLLLRAPALLLAERPPERVRPAQPSTQPQ